RGGGGQRCGAGGCAGGLAVRHRLHPPGARRLRAGGLPPARDVRARPVLTAMTGPDAATAVTACGQAAKAAAPHLTAAPAEAVDAALHGMARRLGEAAPAVLAANAADVAAGEAGGPGPGVAGRPALRRAASAATA